MALLKQPGQRRAHRVAQPGAGHDEVLDPLPGPLHAGAGHHLGHFGEQLVGIVHEGLAAEPGPQPGGQGGVEVGAAPGGGPLAQQKKEQPQIILQIK